jgi:hypothetical protein
MARTAPRTDIDWELEEAEAAAEAERYRGRNYLTPEEGREIFEYQAQKLMGMSGEEFIRRWEAGEYWDIADKEGFRHIGDLIAMIPLARQDG